MMHTTITFIIAICISNVTGFSLYQSRQGSACRHPAIHTPQVILSSSSPRTTQLHSSPDDKQAEIEALEEKLRQLKGEQVDQVEPSEGNESTLPVTEDDEQEWAVMKGQTNDSVMLSERWKETDPSSNSDGGMLKNVAIALGLVVFLGIFSQVPIGNEDLQRYQDYKGSASRIDMGDLNPDVKVQL